MIISIRSDDGQDFIIVVGEGNGSVGITTVDFNNNINPTLEHFTVEEVQAIVGSLNTAIKIALEERDAMEGLK